VHSVKTRGDHPEDEQNIEQAKGGAILKRLASNNSIDISSSFTLNRLRIFFNL